MSGKSSEPIPDTDFSILFGNLLENAWEAASQTPENAYIRIQIQPQKNNIVAMIENSCKKEPIQKANRFFSTKHSGMGIGTRSARLIVDKAKGVISFEPKDEIFVVRFVLPNVVSTEQLPLPEFPVPCNPESGTKQHG